MLYSRGENPAKNPPKIQWRALLRPGKGQKGRVEAKRPSGSTLVFLFLKLFFVFLKLLLFFFFLETLFFFYQPKKEGEKGRNPSPFQQRGAVARELD